MNVINGIQVIAVRAMPAGFAPNLTYPPLWLQQGTEIAVTGTIDGKTVVLGFSGPQLGNQRVIAEDSGAGTSAGHILDIATSPDGLDVATAVAEPTQNRLEIVMREALSSGNGHPVASFQGNFHLAQLIWLDQATLALLITSSASGDAQVPAQDGTNPSSGSLHIITVTGQTSTRHLDKIRCPLSRLSFSPNGDFAVGEGDAFAPPMIADMRDQTCRELAHREPIKILAWSFDSTSFLYTSSERRHAAAVFRYDLATGQGAVIAISSRAAAYASDGTIVALGSRQLSWRRIAAAPNAKVKAEVALFDPHQAEITVNSLGFETTPAMLARSTMAFSTASDDGVIDLAIPGAAGPLRELIEYSYGAGAGFVLATGAVQSPVAMSWSPDGHSLAIVESTAQVNTLAVIVPPK
jgi:hypothetical protein